MSALKVMLKEEKSLQLTFEGFNSGYVADVER